MLIVEAASPLDPGPRARLEARHALMRGLFPPEETHVLDPGALCGGSIRVFAARDGGETLGTGALAIKEEHGEVTSKFTTPAALPRANEGEARALKRQAPRLESDEALEPAMRPYTRHGFTRRRTFGKYRLNPTTVFMEKPLV